MIKDNTLLILGAGASMPYGFPSGQKLIHLIYKKLDTTDANPFLEFINPILNNNHEHFNNLRNSILYSGAASIDDLLESRKIKEEIEIAKLAIHSIISDYEKIELFNPYLSKNEFDDYFTKGFEFFGEPWVRYFWKNTYDLLRVNQLKPQNLKLSIINFNYDRHFETFFFNAVKYKYKLTDTECIEQLSEVEIIHPYGKIGNTSFDTINILSNTLQPYGTTSNTYINDKKEGFSKAQAIAKQITTYSESVDANLINRLKKTVENARRIIFLGFGFHRQNLELIFQNTGIEKDTIIMGSMYNMGSGERNLIYENVSNLIKLNYGPPIQDSQKPEWDCLELLRQKADVIFV